MAVKEFVTISGKGIQKGDLFGYWDLSEGDTATPIIVPRYADKSVQMFGTWGGATITIKQSNDVSEAVFGTAEDIFGSDIESTEDSKVFTITANSYALKPAITGGSGANIRISIIGRGIL